MASYSIYSGVTKLQTFLDQYRRVNPIYSANVGGAIEIDGKFGPQTAAAYDAYVADWRTMSAVDRKFKEDPIDYLQVQGVLTSTEATQVKQAQREYQIKVEQGDTTDDGQPSLVPDSTSSDAPVLPLPTPKTGMTTTTWVVLGVVVGTGLLVAWKMLKKPGKKRSFSGCGCGK